MFHCVDMCSSQGRRGELLVSLCYNPTANTITVNIIKARNLKAMDIGGTSGRHSSMFIHVFLSLTCAYLSSVILRMMKGLWLHTPLHKYLKSCLCGGESLSVLDNCTCKVTLHQASLMTSIFLFIYEDQEPSSQMCISQVWLGFKICFFW